MLFKGTNLIHGILYLVFFSASIVTYLVISYVDPGYLTNEKAQFFAHRREHSFDDEQSENPHDRGGPMYDGLQPSLTLITNEPIEMNQTKVVFSDANASNNKPLSPWWRDFSWLHHCFRFPFSTFFIAKLGDPQDYPALNLSVPVRFCRHCRLEQPLRCRHCPDCNRCVMKFDHHCPWISNCVGERNHSVFLVFLILQDLVLWWTLYLANSSITPSHLWSDWFRINGLFLTVMIVLALIGVPVTALLGFHIYLALANRTTWETVAYENITYLRHLEDRTNPFNQGCVRNCYFFCCSPFPFGWDLLYAEAVEQKNLEPSRPIYPTGSLNERLPAQLTVNASVPLDVPIAVHLNCSPTVAEPVTASMPA
ncbi:unnamed protein product [Dicrocoelium dendriticum]|nr:unnamed protein product [Dicrocoelium dendriticum]